MIEDNSLSRFHQILTTERPDKVVDALMEGFVAVLLDNTSFVLILLATLPLFIQAPAEVRLPKPIGQAVGIVGELVIGEAAFKPVLLVLLW